MELEQAIVGRYSVRNFTEQQVEEDTIRHLIDLGIQAPSGTNRQDWSFAVIQNKKVLEEISDKTKEMLFN